jgi:hypothetical protein
VPRTPPQTTPLRLAIVNDYEVVVRGLGDMLLPFSDEIVIVELDSTVQVTRPVDIMHDEFQRRARDGFRPGAYQFQALAQGQGMRLARRPADESAGDAMRDQSPGQGRDGVQGHRAVRPHRGEGGGDKSGQR